ncbi:PRD domain-containing protein [Vibrio fluvialis]|nr:PRD domain-containing protein [Vibrio fluvialis]
MKLDVTSLMVLKKLVSEKSVTVNNISSDLKLSKSSVYQRLDKINYWLKLHGLSSAICCKNSSMTISDEQKNIISKLVADIDNEYIMKPCERIDNILMHLLSSSGKIDICHLSELNGASRNTTLNDIKKATINSYNVNVEYKKKVGYQIYGDETSIRILAFEVIQRNLHRKVNFIQNTLRNNTLEIIGFNKTYIYQVLSKIVNDIQYYTSIRFTDKDRKLLTSLFYLFIVRVAKGCSMSISTKQKNFIKDQVDMESISKVFASLSKALKINIDNDEYFFVGLLVIVLKSQSTIRRASEFELKVQRCVENMVFSFEKLSGIYFISRDKLSSQLFTHLKPAIVRCLFGIKVVNILKDEVYESYPLIMDMVKVVSKYLESEFDIILSEDELCYIAMNFASHVSNEYTTTNKEKHILLITEGGRSSTRLLESQIFNLSLFPICMQSISASDISEGSDFAEYSFIITTSQVIKLNTSLDVVHVNHILTTQQQIKIKLLLEGKDYSWLTGELSDKIARDLAGKRLTEKAIKIRVDELLEYELRKGLLSCHSEEFSFTQLSRRCLISEQCDSWDDAIDIAGSQLVLSQHIDKRYLESIKDNIAQYGQYMYLADDIFLLHASPRYNLKQAAKLSLLKINEFSVIQGKPALVFLLVTSESGQQIKILEKLNTLLIDDDAIQVLLRSNELTSIQKLISSFD